MICLYYKSNFKKYSFSEEGGYEKGREDRGEVGESDVLGEFEVEVFIGKVEEREESIRDGTIDEEGGTG
jgi:hypothetical protein